MSRQPTNERRCRTLIRALGILRKLEGGGRWTLHQLAQEFGVTQRTIRRDIYALEEAGVPIGHNPYTDCVGEESHWWLVRRKDWAKTA